MSESSPPPPAPPSLPRLDLRRVPAALLASRLEEWAADISRALQSAIGGSAAGLLTAEQTLIGKVDLSGGDMTGPLSIEVESGGAALTVVQSGDGSALQVSDGSAPVPAVVFVADVDTGIFRAGGDQLAISAGGVQQLVVKHQEVEINRRLLALGSASADAEVSVSVPMGRWTFYADRLTGDAVLYDDTGAAVHASFVQDRTSRFGGPVYVPSADPVATDELAHKAYVDRMAPPGAIVAFARNTPPAGWLRANGAAVSRTVYAALFAEIGTTWGVGDGSTTFNLPDFRGEFIRGWDDGRGVDSGRVFASAQGDAMRNLTGAVGTGHSLHLYGAGNASGVFALTGATGQSVAGSAGSGFYASFDIDASRQVPTASEFRPRNVAALICIKY